MRITDYFNYYAWQFEVEDLIPTAETMIPTAERMIASIETVFPYFNHDL